MFICLFIPQIFPPVSDIDTLRRQRHSLLSYTRQRIRVLSGMGAIYVVLNTGCTKPFVTIDCAAIAGKGQKNEILSSTWKNLLPE